MKKSAKIRAVLDMVCVVLLVLAALLHLVETLDWWWIRWALVVVLLYMRVWTGENAKARAEDEAESWRILYEEQANLNTELIWKAELRKDGDTNKIHMD